MQYKCPVCKKNVCLPGSKVSSVVDGRGEFFPFCSERCKLVDLGAWFDGEYSIPAEPESPGSEEDLSDDSV